MIKVLRVQRPEVLGSRGFVTSTGASRKPSLPSSSVVGSQFNLRKKPLPRDMVNIQAKATGGGNGHPTSKRECP